MVTAQAKQWQTAIAKRNGGWSSKLSDTEGQTLSGTAAKQHNITASEITKKNQISISVTPFPKSVALSDSQKAQIHTKTPLI